MNDPDESTPLRALIGELPRAIDPAHDLWAGIEARIAAPRRSRAWELALAAGIAAVVVSALFIGFSRGLLGDGGGRDGAPQWAYEQLDTAYAPLREASLDRFRGRADRLDPALRHTVEVNLAIIDRALTEIRSALANRPSDAALGAMLKRTYEQELAIIEAVAPSQEAPVDQSRYRGEL